MVSDGFGGFAEPRVRGIVARMQPRSRTADNAPPERAWIGLDEASRILGISATTLRRWSDGGLIETFVTPGGHRRFRRDAVHALLPQRASPPTMHDLGETPEHIARVYRRACVGRQVPWLGQLDESLRTIFREHGRIIAAQILAALDAQNDADRDGHIRAAAEAAAEYGVAAALSDIPVSSVVEAFQHFREPFVGELWAVAGRRGLAVAETSTLVRKASDAFDELLMATVRAYEEVAADAAVRPVS